jgi:hypothetical protein
VLFDLNKVDIKFFMGLLMSPEMKIFILSHSPFGIRLLLFHLLQQEQQYNVATLRAFG